VCVCVKRKISAACENQFIGTTIQEFYFKTRNLADKIIKVLQNKHKSIFNSHLLLFTNI
jgi:hypothetical protein